MAAALIHIADAVVALLNGGTYAESFTAARVVDPVVTLEALSTLNVGVMGRKSRTVILTRGGHEEVKYVVDIGIRKKLSVSALKAEHDELLWVVEQITERLAKHPLTGRDETILEISTDSTGDSDWAFEDVRNGKAFVAIVSATYLGGR